MMPEVLETSKNVSDMSRDVLINRKELGRFVRKLLSRDIQSPQWDPSYHYRDDTEKTVFYLLILDTINFCFWPPKGKKKWEFDYQAESLSGYYALAASLKRALESNLPITDAQYLALLSMSRIKKLLGGKGELQLLEDRCKALNELGHILLEEYDGAACRLVEAAGNSALSLARVLAEKFSSFNDYSYYQGRKIFFYKRAQIFTADLYGAFNGKKWGYFTDMDKITAFADYKLPQVLRHVGVLRYSSKLKKKVDSGILIDPGCPEEIEIRANTIYAVELIRRELDLNGKSLKAFEIDWFLWNLGQENAYREKPYHKTATVFY